MDEKVSEIVSSWIRKTMYQRDERPVFLLTVVWKVKVLQNWRYLVSSSWPDGSYFLVTYDGDRDIFILDTLERTDHQIISGGF